MNCLLQEGGDGHFGLGRDAPLWLYPMVVKLIACPESQIVKMTQRHKTQNNVSSVALQTQLAHGEVVADTCICEHKMVGQQRGNSLTKPTPAIGDIEGAVF